MFNEMLNLCYDPDSEHKTQQSFFDHVSPQPMDRMLLLLYKFSMLLFSMAFKKKKKKKNLFVFTQILFV